MAVACEPEQKARLDEILPGYTGEPELLGHFLNKFGSDNPWEANNNAVLKRAVIRKKDELADEQEILGVSVSGHKLTKQMYVLAHKFDPTRGWISGSQAITKIKELVGDYAFTPEGQEEIRQKKKKQAQQTVKEVGTCLEDFLTNPDMITDVSGRIAKQKLHDILQLDDELRARLQKLDEVVYGKNAIVDEGCKTYLLSADPGGQFLGWFKRQKDRLPQSIRDIYTTITNPHIEVPDNERGFMMTALIAYSAANMPIRREAVIGSWQKDLTLIMGLSDAHPIIAKYGKPDLSPIRHILQQNEITLVDATRVYDVYPVNEVRKEINGEYSSRFSNEIDSIKEILEPLFKKDGKMRDDSYGSSVPLERLKRSVYFSTLTRNDFASVMEIIRLETIANSTEETYAAVDIDKFKELTDSIVCSARKVAYMNKKLEEGEVVVENIEEAEELADDLRDNMFRGSKYDIVENFGEKNGIELDEVIRRCSAVHKNNGAWFTVEGYEIKEAAETGLYNSKSDSLTTLTKLAENITPVSEVGELKTELDTVLAHPLITNMWGYKSDTEYLSKAGLASWQKLAEKGKALVERLDQEIAEVNGDDSEKVTKLLEKRKALSDAKVYSYSEFSNSFSMKESRFSISATSTDGINHIDIKNLEGKVEGYTKASELDDEWVQRAKFVARGEANPILNTLGYKTPSNATLSTIFKWRDQEEFGENAYVSDKFVEIVNKAYEKVDELQSDPSLIVKGRQEFQHGIAGDMYKVGIIGTKFKDKETFKQRFKGYFWRDKQWNSRYDVGRIGVMGLMEAIKQYNADTGSNCRLRLEVTQHGTLS